MAPRVNLIILFDKKLLTLFSKLDLFMEMQQILLMFIKWQSLQNMSVNLCQNSFMRLTPSWTLTLDFEIMW
jgi:hypothetical protein